MINNVSGAGMKTLVAFAAMVMSCTAGLAQISPSDDPTAQALGFRNYGDYLNSASFCLNLLSKHLKAAKIDNVNVCGKDVACWKKSVRARNESMNALLASPEWSSRHCSHAVPKILIADASPAYQPVDPASPSDTQGRPFEIAAAVQSCKYVVADQMGNYALMDISLCAKPRRDDRGDGDVNGYGMAAITLNGSRCNAMIEEPFLSKSSALEKFAQKCD